MSTDSKEKDELLTRNPWKQLKEGECVLDVDRPYIEYFNSNKGSEKPDQAICTSRVPAPWLGSLDASVIWLLLNPRGDASNVPNEDIERTRQADLENLKSQAQPHIGVQDLNPWWKKALSKIATSGNHKQIAQRFRSIEFFPYWSLSFGAGNLRLPSQQYTFELVNYYLDQGKVVVVGRGARSWMSAVPRLWALRGKNVILANNPRSASISEGNLSPTDFRKIRNELGIN